MTSAWWLDASQQACWNLVADAHRWPRWWRSIPSVGPLPRLAEPMGQWRAWRALFGRPLRLLVGARLSEPCQLIEWQIRGDIDGNLTWVLAAAASGGCDVTCRWEVRPFLANPALLRSLACLVLERSHFGRMRACARDMGVALECTSAPLREWSGMTHR
ncbi:SRPBCC family protein [Ideonella sp. A 288]|uniref:SRPBCC family protein n=1 Tax=Ideonella sp. A 288 TaxID=1962181 RepID=UPI003855A372